VTPQRKLKYKHYSLLLLFYVCDDQVLRTAVDIDDECSRYHYQRARSVKIDSYSKTGVRLNRYSVI